MDGQYVAYSFYRVDPEWRRLPEEERQAGKAYEHYRERFRRAFEDAGESFERVVDRIGEWLQGR